MYSEHVDLIESWSCRYCFAIIYELRVFQSFSISSSVLHHDREDQSHIAT